MRLDRFFDATSEGSGLVCRQGRLNGAVGLLLFSLILVGAPIFWWWVGIPWNYLLILVLLAVVVIPLLVGDFRARSRAGNWLVWIRSDGLWINFRSYRDQSSLDSWAVVKLDYDEIAAVNQHVETYTTPGSEGSERQKLSSLEIRLTHSNTSELEAALSATRHHAQPERVYLGFIRVTSGVSHFPVSLPAADVIRVAWRGGRGNQVTPSLRKTLAELAQRVAVTEPSRRSQPDWSKLSDDDLNDRILELTRSGNKMDAVELLVRRRGYSRAQAHQFVEELNSRI